MTILLLTNALKSKCDQLRRFAERPDNWQLIEEDGTPNFVTGDKPEYCILADDYRIVFSITHFPARYPKPLRYLSVSIRGRNYPLPPVLYTLAHLVGFTEAKPNQLGIVTEPAESWRVGLYEDEHCVIVQQNYDGEH